MSTYYLLLFVIFIIVSSIICKEVANKKSVPFRSFVLALGMQFLLLVMQWFINGISNYFPEDGIFIIAYIGDVVIPVAITLLGIYFISKIFQYEVSFPLWGIGIVLGILITIYPLYISSIKDMYNSLNTLFYGEETNAFTFMDAFTSQKTEFAIVHALSKIPGIGFALYLVICKLRQNREN